jgi:hypothetical protein
MDLSEAEAKARRASMRYRAVTYVIETERKRYAVVSEMYYCERGLEHKIVAMYDSGKRV